MNKPLRIHIIGKDDWALGTEYRLACEYLGTFTEVIADPGQADFLHTVDVEGTASSIYHGNFLPKVPIVGAVNNHPTRLVEWPGFFDTAKRFMYLVPQSTIAFHDMKRLGFAAPWKSRIATDSTSYFPIDSYEPQLQILRKHLGIPENTYLIGLLQRDSEGRDLSIPKRQKGPDIFLALMMMLKKRVGGSRFHVLLGGPRRHWLRSALDKESISYSFMGDITEGEDYPQNILDKETMCQLYNLLDLYVIPTRWEGAPRQVFDVLECEQKIISTPVGIAPDILPAECIFDSLSDGVKLIESDMNNGFLNQFVGPGRNTVKEPYSIHTVGKEWENVYRKIVKQMKTRTLPGHDHTDVRNKKIISFYRLQEKSLSLLTEKTRFGKMIKEYFPKKVGVFAENRDQLSPIDQLMDRLNSHGVSAEWNQNDADIFLFWGRQDDTARFSGERIILVIDDLFACRFLENRVNKSDEILLGCAETTVFTNDVSFSRILNAGIRVNNPIIIRFPPDKTLFKTKVDAFSNKREMRCLVFHDSNLQLSDEWFRSQHLIDRFTFIVTDDTHHGWLLKTLEQRAAVLKEHDAAVVFSSEIGQDIIYEILSCGLPCLYDKHLADIKQVIGMAGIEFDNINSFREGIGRLREHHECYCAAISVPSIDDAAITLASIVYTPSTMGK